MERNSPDGIWERLKKGVFVIAEAGKNFIQTKDDRPVSEYLANAKELVDKAAWAGADAIKFQTHNVEDEQHPDVMVTAAHFKGLDRLSWVTRNTNATPVNEFWKPLKAYCEERGIIFFSTPMSRGAARRLMDVGVSLWKIGSGDLLDRVMFDYLRNTDIPIIMSSGASSFEEVADSLLYLRQENKRVALMHALSKYPGRPEEANLATMELYRDTFGHLGVPVGFSENSIGIEPSLIAVTMGATMIEKHFTTDRGLWGADHKVCSTPSEFKVMVDQIRMIERDPVAKSVWLEHPLRWEVQGIKEKVLREDEKPFRPTFQKSLAAGEDIPAGTRITPEMVYAMRPRAQLKGLPSEYYEQVLGRTTGVALKKYDAINADVLKD